MSFSKELMTGAAEAIVLQALREHGASYGYELIGTIAKDSGDVFAFREGTLYPLLYRLERRNYVTSERRTAPSGKERRYYAITSTGRVLLTQRSTEYAAFFAALKQSLHFAGV